MLAHTYKGKGFIAGYCASEKLDGMRALWYPETRGMLKGDVPFANSTNPEHACTGLWSRLGNVIHAPDWFVAALPADRSLDGELYGDESSRQRLMSAVKKYVPIDAEWENVQYYVYSIPDTSLTTRAQRHIISQLESNHIVVPHIGVELPYNGLLARKQLDDLLQSVLDRGGEGIIIRDPNAKYEFCRSHSMLKVKGREDMEVIVMGCTSGRETDKGSKLLGLMGALIVSDGKVIFQISGFTDEERALEGFRHTEAMSASEWARKNPDSKCPDWIQPKHFPIGTMITIQYRGKSDDGVPQEARYWRKRDTME